MAGKVEVKAFGKEADLLESYQKVIRKQGQMLSQLRKVSNEAKKGGKSAKAGNASWVRSIAGVAGAYVGVSQAIRLISDEIGNMRERWREAAAAITESQGLIGNTVLALPPEIAVLGRGFTENLMNQMVSESFISRREAQNTLTFVGSTTQGGGPESFSKIARGGARASSITPGEDAPLFAGAAAKIGLQLGLVDNPNAALGVMAALFSGTPITDLATLATNLPKALGKVTGQVSDTEKALEGMSIFLQLGADDTGRLSATAFANVAKRLKTQRILPNKFTGELERLPDEFRDDPIGALVHVRGRFGEFDFVEQTNIVGRITESTIGSGIVNKIIENSPDTANVIRGAIESFGPLDTPEEQAVYERRFKTTVRRARDQQPLFQLQRAGRSAVDLLQHADPSSAIRGILSEQIPAIARASGSAAIRQRLLGIQSLLDNGAPDALSRSREFLEDLRSEFQPRATTMERIPGERFFVTVPGQVGQPEFVAAINTMIKQIEKLQTSMEENTAAVRNPSGPNGATNRATARTPTVENQ